MVGSNSVQYRVERRQAFTRVGGYLVAVFAVIAGLAVAQIDVPFVTPPCDPGLAFTVDTTWPGGGSPFSFWNSSHQLTVTQMGRLVDRQCSIWNRLSASSRTCSWSGSTAGLTIDDPVLNGASSVTFPSYSMSFMSAAASANLWSAECDMSFFHDTDSPARRWASATTVAPLLYYQGVCFNEECTLVTRNGAASDLAIPTTALHETGHVLGLAHSASCNGITEDCPVMNGTGNRVSYYPTSDDLRNMAWGRQTDVFFANIDSGGTVGAPGFACSLSGLSYAPVRVACAPDSATEKNCVVSQKSVLDELPTFTYLTVQSTPSCAASTQRTGSLFADGAVDVAFGLSGRVIGVGKRATKREESTSLIIYRVHLDEATVSVLLAPSDDDTEFVDLRTHTEPRVAFNENRNRFLVAYPTAEAKVHVLSLNSLGQPLTSSGAPVPPLSLGLESVYPVEIACDNHNVGVSNLCHAYVISLDHSNAAQDGRAERVTLDVAADGSVSALSSSFVGTALSQLADATSYGNGRIAGQYNAGAWVLVGENFADISSNEYRFMLDDDGQHDPSSIAVASLSVPVSGIPLGRRSAFGSADWSERAARFVVVSPR